eukprot:739399-Pelagomonas_calceolata.AAC.3
MFLALQPRQNACWLDKIKATWKEGAPSKNSQSHMTSCTRQVSGFSSLTRALALCVSAQKNGTGG